MATDRPRLGSGDASLSPELIAQRGFLTSRRGFDPDEVKTFLARIAEEFRSMRQREATLERALRDAEERAAHPTLDENTLMAAVGEETASILRSAHAAAADITTKAKDNAARILRESHEQAAAMRQDAETVLARRTTEADAAAARIREAGEAEVEQLRQGARQEGETVRAQAEAERKVTIEAAQGARERILSDLTRRRKVAVVQIEQLRVGRERLLEAYKVVRRTLDEVTDELQRADGEARAAAEAAGRRPLPSLLEDEVGGVEGAVVVKDLPSVSAPAPSAPAPSAPAPSVPAPSVPAPFATAPGVAGTAPAGAGSTPPPKQEVE
ncbi:MAG TPA: DivIVA domain-containing protein, partial [Acidimicrobiales bacterium]|nr:DivIVA domain-containing protein [Acidimicrobiales bacterium]